MKDDVELAIEYTQSALAEIEEYAGGAQKREDQGKGTIIDSNMVKWIEEMEHKIEKALALLCDLKFEARLYDEVVRVMEEK